MSDEHNIGHFSRGLTPKISATRGEAEKWEVSERPWVSILEFYWNIFFLFNYAEESAPL